MNGKTLFLIFALTLSISFSFAALSANVHALTLGDVIDAIVSAFTTQPQNSSTQGRMWEGGEGGYLITTTTTRTTTTTTSVACSLTANDCPILCADCSPGHVGGGCAGGVNLTSCKCNKPPGCVPTTTTITTSITGPTIYPSCIYGTATATNSVNYGSYKIYATLGSTDSWAKIEVKDSVGNPVETKIINQLDAWDFSAGFTVKVVKVAALQDGTVIGADLAVGATGTYCAFCSDSDGGLNYYVAGITRGMYGGVNGFTNDYCTNATDSNNNPINLVEFYCIDSRNYGPKGYLCPNGCSNGACIQTTTTTTTTTIFCTNDFDCPTKMKCTSYSCPACPTGAACAPCMPNHCVDVGCVPEGGYIPGAISPEYRNHMATECCQGLSAIEPSQRFDQNCNRVPIAGEPSGVCTKCGNGVCGPGENKCNCPQDCGSTCPYECCENDPLYQNKLCPRVMCDCMPGTQCSCPNYVCKNHQCVDLNTIGHDVAVTSFYAPCTETGSSCGITVYENQMFMAKGTITNLGDYTETVSASISACPSYITTTTTVVPLNSSSTTTATSTAGAGGSICVGTGCVIACKILYSGDFVLDSSKSWNIMSLASLPAGSYRLSLSASISSDSDSSNNYQNVYLTVKESLQSYALNFKAGWNLFSVPVTYVSTSNSNCQPESPVWGMYNGNYYETTYTNGGYAYWVKMKSDCTTNITGRNITISNFPTLNDGWNMVGAPSETVNIDDVKGTCTAERGPLWYDPSIGNYVKSSVLQQGRGYFIKVSDACRLGTGLPPPPPS